MKKINLCGGDALPLAHTLLFATPSSGDTPQRPVICVTGKMAAGKNYFCSLLEKQGWKTVDLDILVHQAIKEQTPVILKTFADTAEKENICLENSDGTLNRRELGKLVFSNPQLLKKQEDIVYPAVIQLTKKFISNNSEFPVVINAAVLYKTPELMSLCTKIAFITAPFFTRLKRAKKRDKMPVKQILKRFWSQRTLLKEYKNTGKEILLIINK